jgi:hypothetical protein
MFGEFFIILKDGSHSKAHGKGVSVPWYLDTKISWFEKLLFIGRCSKQNTK